ncbi:MAG: hypothetical protein RSC44_04215, partial [Clostridia bacterium]
NGITTAQAQASNINYTDAHGIGTHFKVTSNFTVTNALKTGNWSAPQPVTNFKPIGAYDTANTYIFNGTFDGGGKTITLDLQFIGDKLRDYVGLFGYVGGTISNVTVAGNVSGQDYVGGIAGRLVGTITNDIKKGTIINCTNSGSVGGVNYVGGIVGYSTGTISNCTKTVTTIIKNTIETKIGSVIASGNYVGGIVGYADNCDFSGSLTNKCYIEGNSYVGGIIGYYKATTAHTWNNFVADNSCETTKSPGNDGVSAKSVKDINNVNTGGSYAGGIFGYIEIAAGGSLLIGDTSTLKNTATVDSENGGSSVIGGIVGFNGGATITAKMLVACGEGVYSRGTATLTLNGKQYTGSFAGGIVGVNLGTISNATFESGDVISVSQGDFVGGIAGFNLGTISNCSTKANGARGTYVGTVAGTGSFYGNYFGGIVGYSVGGEISGTI